MAGRVGGRVVSDVRSRDVAAGGQGAPLVPLADVMLFGHPERGRLLLNVGGIANVTWVPRRGSAAGAPAFDTRPRGGGGRPRPPPPPPPRAGAPGPRPP